MHGNTKYAAKWISQCLTLETARRVLRDVGLDHRGSSEDVQTRLSRHFQGDSRSLLDLLNKAELVALCENTQITQFDGHLHTVHSKGHPNTLRDRLEAIFEELLEIRRMRRKAHTDDQDPEESDLTEDDVDDSDLDSDLPPVRPERIEGIGPGAEVVQWLAESGLRYSESDVPKDDRVESWLSVDAKKGNGYVERKIEGIEDVPRGSFHKYGASDFPDLVHYLIELERLRREPKVARQASTDPPFSRPWLDIRIVGHYKPMRSPDQWGIYLHADGLVHAARMQHKNQKELRLFSFELLCHFLVFEIFHHEFYHHLVESFAISTEIILNHGSGKGAVDVYRRLNGYDREEALANAYAHNAFGMANRLIHGGEHHMISLYQRGILKGWETASAGYRDAGKYIKGRHVLGNQFLIARALDERQTKTLAEMSAQSVHDANDSLRGRQLDGAGILARHVMPQGHTAMVHKPKIPLYLVGSRAAMEELLHAVPDIRGAATSLFLPFDLSEINEAVKAYVKTWRSERGFEQDQE